MQSAPPSNLLFAFRRAVIAGMADMSPEQTNEGLQVFSLIKGSVAILFLASDSIS
jgi:hypothetical protein